MKEKIKNKLKGILIFILGGIILGGFGVYAATTIQSSAVSYSNTSSGATSTNVQGAIDELYTRASKWLNPNDMGTPTNYIFGETVPETYSPTTPPSGKNVYLGLYADDQYGVCIKRNGTQHCFRWKNWLAEAKHVQEVFSDISCQVTSNGHVNCFASDFDCSVTSYGEVSCIDHGTKERCTINGFGTDYGGCYGYY